MAQDFRLRSDRQRRNLQTPPSLRVTAKLCWHPRPHAFQRGPNHQDMSDVRQSPRIPRRRQLSRVELTLQRHVAGDVVYELLSRKLPPALSFDECV